MVPGLREVHAAAQVVRNLAHRTDPVDPDGNIPRTIRRQQWSAFNVPLTWATASGDQECLLLQWLCQAASKGPPVQVTGIDVRGEDAVLSGRVQERNSESSGQRRPVRSVGVHIRADHDPRLQPGFATGPSPHPVFGEQWWRRW